jgi:hypothetical protein
MSQIESFAMAQLARSWNETKDANPRLEPSSDATRTPRNPIHMKRYLACAAVIGLLSACTQEQSLRDTRAAGYYVTDQTVEAVETCVTGKWATKSAQLGVVQLSGGTSVEVWDGKSGPLIALVDILATGATTTAKYYSKSGDRSWYSDQVMDCMHATHSID